MGLAIFKYLLPAISSIAIAIPAGMAAKKFLYAEAFIYAFTTAFQILHHLCESPVLSFIFCMLGDDLLRFFSTHGLILSMFVTIINLTKFTRSRRLTFCISGGTIFSVRLYQTTDGYGVYSAPLLISIFFLCFSWGRHMYTTKKLYPEKSLWIKTVLPALVFGSLSVVLLLVVEDSFNYGFIHTLHHISLAIAIGLCLQITEDGEKANNNEKICNCNCISAIACCC